MLHREACELVPRIQAVAPRTGVAAFTRSLDAPLFAYKADLVAGYGLAARGRDATPAEAAVVRDTFAWIAGRDGNRTAALAHRDYQSSNLVCPRGPARRAACA
jgi:hypothetical protein